MMSTALVKLASVAESIVTDKFKDLVVTRWTHYRAKRFFEAFVEGLQTEQTAGHEIPEVDRLLDTILADETKSELLFDAYRRICFTKSKTLGPRIIGLLTGELVIQGRMATQGEECVFEAAETLSDGEFIGFLKKYEEYRRKAAGITDQSAEICSLGESIIVRWYQQDLDTFRETELGPVPWVEAFGSWAVKLNRCGLITDRTRQKSNLFGGAHGITVETHITFDSSCVKLSRLLLRSVGSEVVPGCPS